MRGGTLLMIFAATCTGVSGSIVQCIDRKLHSVILNCPTDRVIYRPIISMGSGKDSTCQQQDGDCAGLSLEVEKKIKSCFWKTSCEVSWSKSQMIMIAKNSSCLGSRPTYAVYDNPTCVPTDELVDMSTAGDHMSTLPRGIIRSSPNYPYHFKDLLSSHQKVLRPRAGHFLVLTLDHLEVSGQNSLTIYTQTEKGRKVLLRERMAETEHFQVNEENVTILFNVSAGERLGGFVIRFEYRKNEHPNNVKFKNHIDHKSSFNVKGSIDSCMARRDSLSFVCPSGHVIYNADVTTGVSNGGKCMLKGGDCQGLTHTLITQINKCYWKNSCKLSWSKGVPLTMTNTLNCLAQNPDYIALKSYKCLSEDDVYNICDDRNKMIYSREGIIRSHHNYPWHYQHSRQVCRKYISFDKDMDLRVTTLTIDLDPDVKGDNLKFYQGRSKKPMKTVRAGRHADLIIRGGCAKIEFRISKRSKGGQGFLLKFEPRTKQSTKMKQANQVTCEEVNKSQSSSTDFAVADSNGEKQKPKIRRKYRNKNASLSNSEQKDASRALKKTGSLGKKRRRKGRKGRKRRRRKDKSRKQRKIDRRKQRRKGNKSKRRRKHRRV